MWGARAGTTSLKPWGRLRLVAAAVALSSLTGLVAVIVDAVDAPWRLPILATATAGMVVAGVSWRTARQLGTYVGDLEHSRGEFHRALARLGQALEASGDRRSLLEVVVESTQAILGTDHGVFFADAATHVVAKVARGAPEVLEQRLAHGEGLAGWVASRGEPARFPPGPAPVGPEPAVGTALAVPLYTAGHLFGVLALYGRSQPFDADDLDLITNFARHAQASIDRTFAHEEARRLSITDGLTGLWNRRHLDLRCSEELARADRFGEPFALVMCDLDDFREVNNHHGHQVGDAVLVEVSNRLANSTRQVDLVARYGGEEFVLLLPRTDRAGALEVAEKVRTAVAQEPVCTDRGPVAVSLSLGVACHPEHGTTVAGLIASADAALYRAKRAGKNQIFLADSAPDPGGSVTP